MTGWRSADHRAVADTVAGWQPTSWPAEWSLPGGGTLPGWLGVAETNRPLPGLGEQPPAPNGDPSRPAGFLSWDVDYESEPEGFLDDEQNPVRYAVALLAVYCEPLAGRGHIARLWDELEQLFRTADTSSITFFPNEGRPQRVGHRGEWYVELLSIRFVGT